MGLIADIHKDLEKGALQLMVEYRERLNREAIKLCGDQAKAEDLVLRTIERVLAKADTYKDDINLYAWMVTIMENIHKNDMKRPVVRGTTAVETDKLEEYAGADWSTDEEILKNSDSEALRKALSGLDPKYHQALLLRYYQDFSVKQIAAILQLPLGTVCRRLQIAHGILAGKLKSEFGKAKKPLAVLAALLFGITALFGAYQLGKVEEVVKVEKVEEGGDCASNRRSPTGIHSASEQSEPSDSVSARPQSPGNTSDGRFDLTQETQPQQTQEEQDKEKTMSIWEKAVVGLATVAGLSFPSVAAIDADSYIRRGLIAQWDGIDNLATGTHVADTNVWVDRMGNSTDLTASYLSFTDGKCAYLQGKRIASTCSKLPTTYAESTMEIHAFSPQYTRHNATDALLSTGQGGTLFWQDGSANFGCSYAGNANQVYFAGSFQNQFSFTPAQSRDITTARNTWTMTTGGYTRSVYANGAKGTPAGANGWNWTQDSYAPHQQVRFGSGQDGTHYKAYSIRVYDRQLSQNEIAFNVAIDQVRFQGATLKDLLPATLPDGYRLNATEDGLEVLVNASVLDRSGYLSINGAECAESTEIWVPQGSMLSISYVGKPGFGFGSWTGAPEWAKFPKEGQIDVKACAPLSIGAWSNVESPNPIVLFNSLEVVNGTSLKVGYDVVTAGELADTVTLGVCYGQDPNRLGYTNVTANVIGAGEIRIAGLIPSRTYYVKLVADGNGRIGTSETKSAETEAGSYGTYGADQPVVTRCDVAGMQESLRIRGDVTAPEGTVLLVHYGTTTDIDAMTTVSFGTKGIRGGGYFADIKDLTANVKYYVIVETVNGGFCDRYPIQSATPVPVSAPSVRKVASFNGGCWLRTTEIMTDVFKGSFTMSVWVKNPRGTTVGKADEYGLNRYGKIMGCGNNGGYVPGPSIHVAPSGWTQGTDAAFKENPKYYLSAVFRSELDSGAVQSCTVNAPEGLEIWKDDTWHHVAMTYDQTAKTLWLYLDAQLVGTNRNENMYALRNPNYPMTFGSNQIDPTLGNGRLVGQIAEATVWRGKMDAKGIRRIRRGDFSDNDDKLVAHWLTGREPYLEDFANNTKHPYRLTNPGNGVSFVDAPDFRLAPSPGLMLILK